MKIRFTKSNGKQMELSDIQRVEIVEAGLVKVVRLEVFDRPELSFEFSPNGSGSGICVYDVNIPWPGLSAAVA